MVKGTFQKVEMFLKVTGFVYAGIASIVGITLYISAVDSKAQAGYAELKPKVQTLESKTDALEDYQKITIDSNARIEEQLKAIQKTLEKMNR